MQARQTHERTSERANEEQHSCFVFTSLFAFGHFSPSTRQLISVTTLRCAASEGGDKNRKRTKTRNVAVRMCCIFLHLPFSSFFICLGCFFSYFNTHTSLVFQLKLHLSIFTSRTHCNFLILGAALLRLLLLRSRRGRDRGRGRD